MQHCNFLAERYHERRKSMQVPHALTAEDFDAAYPLAVDQAAVRIDEALAALRPHAPRSSYTVPLPPLQLTEQERAVMKDAG
jgi:hypothetical protein